MKSNQENRPLATLFVIAYNQEKYIRKAVEAAFAQTYTPLEIILTDDSSKDQTFSIMRDMASDYVGPHTVRLNRNEHNLGIGEHINKVVELSRGMFLVAAAGDDISLPERAQALVDHFVSNPKCYSVYSNMNEIDMVGTVGRTWRPDGWACPRPSLLQNCRKGIWVFGCTHAWRKEVFDIFGQLDSRVVHEDIAIPFRSSLVGSVDYLDKALVLYRRHGANTWTSQKEFGSPVAMIERRKRHAIGDVGVRSTMLKDFLHYLDVTKQERAQFMAEISALKRRVLVAEFERDLLNCSSPLGKGRLLIAATLRGVRMRTLARLALTGFAPRVLWWWLRKETKPE